MFRSLHSVSFSLVITTALLSGCGDLAAAVTPPAACEPLRNAVNQGATRIGTLADQADEPADMAALAQEEERFATSVAAVSTDDAELVAVRDEYAAVYRAMADATRRMASATDEAAITAIEGELDTLATREETAAQRLETRCP